jgi:hypothetical protein
LIFCCVSTDGQDLYTAPPPGPPLAIAVEDTEIIAIKETENKTVNDRRGCKKCLLLINLSFLKETGIMLLFPG